MNKMSKKMEYALMALQLISQRKNQGLTTAKEVAEAMQISFEVTARVLQTLSSHGLLKAEYGVGGGYSLAKPLHEVSLHDLTEMLEGSALLTKCLSDTNSCENHPTCNIVSPIANLNKKIEGFYKSVSIAEVLHV